MSKTQEMEVVVSDCALFNGISQKAISDISRIAKKITLPKNTSVFRQGDYGDACYIVLAGAVKGYRTSDNGEAYEFVQLGADESFGEIALFTGKPRPLSVETIAETQLLSISSEDFAPILGKYPDVTAAIGTRVSQWLHKASAAVESCAVRQYDIPRASWRDLFIVVGFSVICALAFNESNTKGIALFGKENLDVTVTFADPYIAFEKQKNHDVIFVDATPNGFYEKKHIPEAVSLPLAIFDFMYDVFLRHVDRGKEIIVYGRTISKHYDVGIANKLVLRGHKNVRILNGGLAAWEKSGFPVEQKKG